MASPLENQILEGAELDQALTGLPGWEHHNQQLVKTFEHPSFPAAIEFVNRLVPLAEALNHHPDIEINYKKVTLRLWTHKLNAITQADLQLARDIEAAP